MPKKEKGPITKTAKPYDVVQITPAAEGLAGCFAVVQSVTPHAIECYVPLGGSKFANVTLNHGHYAVIGQAEWWNA